MMKKITAFITVVLIFCLPLSLNAARKWTAPDQEQAKEMAKKVVPFVSEYKNEGQIARKMRLLDQGLSLSDINDVYFLLDSPIIKAGRIIMNRCALPINGMPP